LDALGKQLVIELKACDPALLSDEKFVKDTMISAAHAAEATIINASFHTFNPHGISGMIIIAESHISIHTWPEYGYAAIDIFTCGDAIHPEVAAKFLIEKFNCEDPSIVEIKRGTILTEGGRLQYKVPT
jgi:S-adenosylmethionine decarboxylase